MVGLAKVLGMKEAESVQKAVLRALVEQEQVKPPVL